MFLNIFWFIFKLTLVASIVGILSIQEGLSEIEWMGWKISISTSFLVGSIIFIMLFSLWFNKIINLILGAPNNFFKAIKEKRQQDGYKALAYGLIASSAGDIEGTKKICLSSSKVIK